MATVDINKITLPNGDVCNLRDSTAPVLVVSKSSASALPATISNANITSSMVCIKAELSNPSAQTADWTVTTSAGSVSVGASGQIASGSSTDIKLYLTESR